MRSTGTQIQASGWLLENGPKELESLLRTIVFHPSAPILITDESGKSLEASSGAGKLLGVPREKIVGRQLKDLAPATRRPHVSELWRAFLDQEEQEGILPLVNADGTSLEVGYIARKDILPVRHVVILQDGATPGRQPLSWIQDYGLYLLDPDCKIAAWYGGARRLYGYAADEAVGRHVSFLQTGDGAMGDRLSDGFARAAAEGHMAAEGWHARKDGSRFWASAVTMALRDSDGELQGFGLVVRDFSDRHERDEKLRRGRVSTAPSSAETTHVAVVSGEFDRIPEANETFLELVGYTREELLDGTLVWPALTPAEFVALDEIAHEEGIRFGSCTPFEKEFIRKDGTRVPVLVTIAVLKLSPFRWISFITDLRGRRIDEKAVNEPSDLAQNFQEIVGSSAPMKRVMAQIAIVAPTDATVLVLGETGTGKELVARAIHRLSPRRNLPFISLNCAAIPTGLLESELFGYERGAFTGALGQKIGRFEMAHRGTLFLDEVGDIPIDLQPKLLRALQEKSFERLGGTRTIPIDVRLVAATNRNLTQMMGDKLFRSDLYYRLKVFPVTTPPLREHAEDIPALVRHFTTKYAAKMDRKIDRIPADVMQALVTWTWPGNVRELENFIERSVILSPGTSLRAPIAELREDVHVVGGNLLLEDVERDHILRIFRETGGVVSNTAAILGLPRTTLNAMMKKLGISRADL